MEAPIKLFVISEEDNLIRLQSQLAVGKDFATHIFQDGKLKVWRLGKEKGISFYETDEPYEIVRNIEEMKYQQLGTTLIREVTINH